MKEGTTRHTLKTSSGSKTNLEKEAKDFVKKRKVTPPKIKPMTSRIYLAGQAMSALMITSPNAKAEDIKKQAYAWADLMLKD